MGTNNIKLRIDRREVSVDEFTEATQALLGIVREVISEMGGKARSVRWLVEGLSSGSAYLEVTPSIVGGDMTPFLLGRAVRAAGEGLQHLDGVAIRPPYFNDAALGYARKFVQKVKMGEAGSVTVGLGETTIAPTQRITANVEELTVGRVKSIGSVDGKLIAVSMGDGLRFSVDDRVRGRRVECRFSDQLLEHVLGAFGKRVIARGFLWSRADGVPQRIDVRALEVVEPDENLPRASAVMGILGGAVSYVEDD